MRLYPKDSLTGGRHIPRARKRPQPHVQARAQPPKRPRKRPRRARSWLYGLFRAAAVLFAAWLAVTVGAVAALRWAEPPATAVMWAEPGPLGGLAWRWIEREGIAADAARAVIAAEDQRFLEHRGFDLDQIESALETYREGGGLRGASTISQQVAKNLFLWNGRSFVRKGLEAYFTLLIEAFWPKERILEVYLNVAEFGPGVFGVDAAADALLGTSAAELTSAEAATLAAVLPSPKRMRADEPSDYVRRRADEIGTQMRLLEQRGHYRGLAW